MSTDQVDGIPIEPTPAMDRLVFIPRAARRPWLALADSLHDVVSPCADNPETWFDPAKTAAAAAGCMRCPARGRCYEYALAAGEKSGLLGLGHLPGSSPPWCNPAAFCRGTGPLRAAAADFRAGDDVSRLVCREHLEPVSWRGTGCPLCEREKVKRRPVDVDHDDLTRRVDRSRRDKR